MESADMPGVEPVEVFARLVYNRELRIDECPERLRNDVVNNLVSLGFCCENIVGITSE